MKIIKILIKRNCDYYDIFDSLSDSNFYIKDRKPNDPGDIITDDYNSEKSNSLMKFIGLITPNKSKTIYTSLFLISDEEDDKEIYVKSWLVFSIMFGFKGDFLAAATLPKIYKKGYLISKVKENMNSIRRLDVRIERM